MLLDKISEIKITKPDDIIVKQIRNIINIGELKPGDKLPSERTLAERFNVGRGYVRLAIQRLEFYGILKTLPKSGTRVSELGVTILDEILGNILKAQDPNYTHLLESRKIIEVQTCQLAAERADNSSKERLIEAFKQHKTNLNANNDAMEEDIMFHIRVAECAKNPVLRSLTMVIAQDIIRQSRAIDSCSGDRRLDALNEHKNILNAIINNDAKAAAKAMKIHLDNTKSE